jgi:hypothetical protein
VYLNILIGAYCKLREQERREICVTERKRGYEHGNEINSVGKERNAGVHLI